MKRMGWFVAGIASAAGAATAGAAFAARRRRHTALPEPDAVREAPVVEPVAAPTPAAAAPSPPPPPVDDAVAAAMREQIGGARMRLREKAEAGVPEPARQTEVE
jgi:hypothetical protein